MAKNTTDYIKLGAFVILTFALFTAGVYYIGNRQNLFGENFRISSVFQNVNGLQKGNSVRYAGINVGIVNDLIIENDSSIRVIMLLESKVQSYIRKDAVANISTDGLVGNMIVNITPGNGDLPHVTEGDVIRSYSRIDPDDVLNTLGNTTENIALLTLNLLEIAEKINEGQGALPMMINDSTIANDLKIAVRNMTRTTQNLNALSRQLNRTAKELTEGDGLIAYLLQDTTFEDRVESMTTGLDSLIRYRTEPMMLRLNETSRNLEVASTELNRIIHQVDVTEGFVGTVLKDTAVSGEFKRIVSNLHEGTVLLNENMEAMRSNFLFRGYFKKQERLERREARKNK